MIKVYKNRSLFTNNTYLIYRNLNNGLFSIKDKKTGLVLAHADNIVAKDVIFIVNDSGRQRALKDKVRNVHAYCATDNCPIDKEAIDISKMIEVTYNPFVDDTFKIKTINEPIGSAEEVYFSNGKAYIKQ